jgi:DNA polymerase-3 subunit beta
MKVLVNRDNFREAIQLASSLTNTRNRYAILLNCVLLKASNGQFNAISTDLDVALRLTVREAQIKREGSVAVAAPSLAKMVERTGLERIQLDATDDEGPNLQIVSENEQYLLMGTNPDDFPVFPDFRPKASFEVKAGDLVRAIQRTAFAVVSAQMLESNYAMQGFLVEFHSGKFCVVGCDARRLSLVKGGIFSPKRRHQNEGSEKISAIVIRKAMELLSRIVSRLDEEDRVKIEIGDSQIRFQTKDAVLVSRLIEGHYPDYEGVFPKEYSAGAIVKREDFLGALRKVEPVVSNDEPEVKLTFRDAKTLEVSAQSKFVGTASVRIGVHFTGQLMEIAFNPRFLEDFLKVADADDVEFSLNDPSKPAVCASRMRCLNAPDWEYLVMPTAKQSIKEGIRDATVQL